MSATVTSVPTGTWNVDPAHSEVGFQVKHMGIATVKGKFKEFAGSLTIAEDGTATASGTVQVASVDTNEAQRDEHLRSPDFFDAATHEQITFTSTAITPVDDETFKITGDITIHGITKSITLEAVFEGSDTDPWGNDRVGLSVTGQINRSDFEMKFNQALGSGNMLVSDKVKLTLDISAVKA
ncbi:YceI family protein [Conexibacter sp. CPCC 206217]|uniref:YceI family protein n=1 Tax=Conexibacter sp. CPCC 206217 TaxID=3064574 RepID=UPI00272313D3|nr:YceI family protein [Conexibacter sp. CPCC 206217]MDO8210896.1 YceI family protein [Conexibacter sp. CPCC 206217]